MDEEGALKRTRCSRIGALKTATEERSGEKRKKHMVQLFYSGGPRAYPVKPQVGQSEGRKTLKGHVAVSMTRSMQRRSYAKNCPLPSVLTSQGGKGKGQIRFRDFEKSVLAVDRERDRDSLKGK